MAHQCYKCNATTSFPDKEDAARGRIDYRAGHKKEICQKFM